MNKHWCGCYICSRNKANLEKISMLTKGIPEISIEQIKEILLSTVGGKGN